MPQKQYNNDYRKHSKLLSVAYLMLRTMRKPKALESVPGSIGMLMRVIAH